MGIEAAGTYRLGHRSVKRVGYGAMQLAGPHVFGPPKDKAEAQAVLRAAIAAGVDHIDTCDYYGPHVVNALIRETLSPYPDDLVLVSKIGARRGDDGAWLPAYSPAELKEAVQDNVDRLGVSQVEIINLRLWGGEDGRPKGGSIEEPLTALLECQQAGLVRHIGLSNVTAEQIEQGRSMAEVVCVQNYYNLAVRGDDALIDQLAADGISYVPFFPLGGFSPLQSDTLNAVAARLELQPMQVALAWLLQRSPNILLIPGTSSVKHLEQNLAVADIRLPADAVEELNGIGAR